MKRIMIAMLSLMLTLPMMAQYGRPRYSAGRYGYSNYSRPSYRHNPVNSYVGFRVGGAFSTVSSDDKYLDGGTMRTGLNVGVVAGFQVAPHAPIYFETGLSFIEKGGKGRLSCGNASCRGYRRRAACLRSGRRTPCRDLCAESGM